MKQMKDDRWDSESWAAVWWRLQVLDSHDPPESLPGNRLDLVLAEVSERGGDTEAQAEGEEDVAPEAPDTTHGFV